MKKWRGILARFVSVNALTQLIALVVGVLVIRGLSKDDYAAYAVFTSFVAAYILLTDSGLSGAVIGFAASSADDQSKLGGLFRTAFRLQRRIAFPQALLGTISLASVLLVLQVPILTVAVLTTGFALVCVPLANRSISVAYRRFRRDYTRLQILNGANATFRLVLVGTLTVVRSISIPALTVTTVAANALDVLIARRGMARDVNLLASFDAAVNSQLKTVYFKALPVSIGVVVQTQLVTVLIGVLGSTDTLAEIAALSRFAAVLAVFSAVVNDVGTGLVAGAQSSSRRLLRSYASVIGAFFGAGIVLTAILTAFAPLLLWLLGTGYEGLQLPLFLVALGTTGIMTADAMRSLNNTLGWVRWSWVYIPALVAWLLLGLFALDLSDVRQAALWMACQAFVGLTTQTVVLLSGARRTFGRRRD